MAHYAIDRKLGEGGMGVVYAAHDERLERVVALKTMTSPRADDTARQRFWREARAAASVNHPNICHIHDIGEDGDRLYIAMELLQGESLADRLKRGVISVSDAMPIGLDMLAALAALHERGVIHRDLKPSNLFLTRNGVKLLDFGLARPELESARGAADLTQPGIAIGTPGYMAPEQVEGGVVDAEQAVQVVYTDWAVRKPWRFHPLAFTERTEPLVTGPRVERYPCAALLVNEETGGRLAVVAPTLCARADLLHRVLPHVAAAACEVVPATSA